MNGLIDPIPPLRDYFSGFNVEVSFFSDPAFLYEPLKMFLDLDQFHPHRDLPGFGVIFVHNVFAEKPRDRFISR